MLSFGCSLASDVAALANTAGGVIVLGVEEDD
jgi:predicted HTH transcriptional regulator